MRPHVWESVDLALSDSIRRVDVPNKQRAFPAASVGTSGAAVGVRIAGRPSVRAERNLEPMSSMKNRPK